MECIYCTSFSRPPDRPPHGPKGSLYTQRRPCPCPAHSPAPSGRSLKSPLPFGRTLDPSAQLRPGSVQSRSVTTPPCPAHHLPAPTASSPWSPISGVPYHPPRRRARPWHCPLTLLFLSSWPAHWSQGAFLSPLAQPWILASTFTAPVPTRASRSLRFHSAPGGATHSPRGVSLPSFQNILGGDILHGEKGRLLGSCAPSTPAGQL